MKRAKKMDPKISTASMPDIIFMLLLFFMVTSQVKEFRGLPVQIPATENAKKIDTKRNNVYCFFDVQERISIDDKLLNYKDLTDLMYMKRTQNPAIVVTLKIDENLKYGQVDKLHKALEDADARRIVYATKTKVN